MREIDYSSWADYILDIIDLYPIKIENALELAAGNCEISEHLNYHFQNYYVTDISKQMLSSSDHNLNKIVCDMSALPFKKEFDVIFSIFDSVNYLMTDDKFVSFLKECSNILSEDGIITFDVSLEKNSLKHLRNLNRKGKYKGIKFKQTSLYDKKNKIHKNIMDIEIDKEVYTETHEQRIYEFEEYFVFAEEAGLRVIDCFDCFSFDDAKRNSERVQFVMGKI